MNTERKQPKYHVVECTEDGPALHQFDAKNELDDWMSGHVDEQRIKEDEEPVAHVPLIEGTTAIIIKGHVMLPRKRVSYEM